MSWDKIDVSLQALGLSLYYQTELSEVLLLRQKNTGGNNLFPEPDGTWHLNKNNPSADHYSIMDELDNFLGTDGLYHFKYVLQDEKLVEVILCSDLPMN